MRVLERLSGRPGFWRLSLGGRAFAASLREAGGSPPRPGQFLLLRADFVSPGKIELSRVGDGSAGSVGGPAGGRWFAEAVPWREILPADLLGIDSFLEAWLRVPVEQGGVPWELVWKYWKERRLPRRSSPEKGGEEPEGEKQSESDSPAAGPSSRLGDWLAENNRESLWANFLLSGRTWGGGPDGEDSWLAGGRWQDTWYGFFHYPFGGDPESRIRGFLWARAGVEPVSDRPITPTEGQVVLTHYGAVLPPVWPELPAFLREGLQDLPFAFDLVACHLVVREQVRLNLRA